MSSAWAGHHKEVLKAPLLQYVVVILGPVSEVADYEHNLAVYLLSRFAGFRFRIAFPKSSILDLGAQILLDAWVEKPSSTMLN